ncbi:OPT oligopeptide transporter protein-domain-containing protein [Cladochytrium replicatum]|nr:OPT oligopeptide transporter protein-domain-containing protein [Cladochytrium replicatum]
MVRDASPSAGSGPEPPNDISALYNYASRLEEEIQSFKPMQQQVRKSTTRSSKPSVSTSPSFPDISSFRSDETLNGSPAELPQTTQPPSVPSKEKTEPESRPSGSTHTLQIADDPAEEVNEEDEEEYESSEYTDDESVADEDRSVIPEVALVVPTTDDPTLPAITFRSFLLGSFFTLLAAGTGQFYFFRSANIILSPFFIILSAYPMGRFLARVLPKVKILGIPLNPGPFNVKEHTVITVCASTSLYFAYAIEILSTQLLYYNTDIGPLGSILLLWTTQCLGYGMAGFLRKWLVYPAAMWWPANLPYVTLYTTLHSLGNKELNRKRFRFFTKAFVIMFVYTLIPGWLAPSLTSVAVLCLAWGGPSGTLDPFIAQLGSGYYGGGVLNFTLDWNYIATLGPLYTPLWSQLNIIGSMLVYTWVITPLMYKSGIWDAKTFPIFSTKGFTTNGTAYNVSMILNSTDLVFNQTLYDNYSPFRMSPYWVMAYGVNFAALTATLVHVALYHGPEIVRSVKHSWLKSKARSVIRRGSTSGSSGSRGTDIEGGTGSRPETPTVDKSEQPIPETSRSSTSSANRAATDPSGQPSAAPAPDSKPRRWRMKKPAMFSKVVADGVGNTTDEFDYETDVHMRLMSKYAEVPTWWYMVLFLSMIGLSILTVHVWNKQLQLEYWGILLAIGIAMLFVLPVGLIQAVSSWQVGLNVVTEYVIGLIKPGIPIGNVVFKTYGYLASYQCLALISDLKLGLYMKIPWRALFAAQFYGTLLGSLVNYAVMKILILSVDDITQYAREGIADDEQWSARLTQIFFTASVIWGAIGPMRIFARGSPYEVTNWFFLIGAILPIPFWLLHKKYPKAGFAYVNWPIILNSAPFAGQNGANTILSPLIVSIVSQWWVRSRHPKWYEKYNFILSAALDAGAMFMSVLIFVVLTSNNVQYKFWALNPDPDKWITSEYCLNKEVGRVVFSP